MKTLSVIDSHTGGEPTRLVTEGGPELGRGPLAERLEIFRRDFDRVRAGIVCEPRGSDVMVGALLCEPHDPACSAGVIFFNNVGFLGMCGHGTIGLIVSLAHMGRIAPGVHRIETPVGNVEAELHADGSVTVRNVPAYRYRTHVPVDVPGLGRIHGDIAWGGNWFFLVADHGQSLDFANVETLTNVSWAIRQALEANGITGEGGALIDHIELFADSTTPGLDSRNFVLCPGKAYDRSPCGTGTSAKIACLAADAALAPGAVWKQESIVGSVFEASYESHESGSDLAPGYVRPSIRGTAHVSAQAQLIFADDDPFAWGIRA
ncbi:MULTISPECIES: 4-hydroxyproline epimerase [Paraburkholderia]|uniref:4-hydroxyproline epimerase n=1 Tax=Paraburkholderia tropica TaxID=92647 RepID=A0A1A5X422_9BURK|nr:4-hydroxyproline epimerase [Paraburkholderia tropica]MBB3003423.1 4-hydroxyproline epimerase [Paraburkholderia tropica]MBB6322439.1 4-hydroxyproline epimerase [Paraburkholderia tropica]OBR48167.1 hydroxyproline-2-epimerase [Paraburkholderia tropica]PXX18056.1 4-hydroxyproline epimerase [Paraburkholderia tropica]